jgi:hypothetical protein
MTMQGAEELLSQHWNRYAEHPQVVTAVLLEPIAPVAPYAPLYDLLACKAVFTTTATAVAKPQAGRTGSPSFVSAP